MPGASGSSIVAPGRAAVGHLAKHEEFRLVHGEHRPEAEHEELFDVAQVTDDFLRRPALWRRTTRQTQVTPPTDGNTDFRRPYLSCVRGIEQQAAVRIPFESA